MTYVAIQWDINVQLFLYIYGLIYINSYGVRLLDHLGYYFKMIIKINRIWTGAGFFWHRVGTSNVRSDRNIFRLIPSSDIPKKNETFGKLELFPSLHKEVERNLLSWIITNINDWTHGPLYTLGR
jgi:hypothetical protein